MPEPTIIADTTFCGRYEECEEYREYRECIKLYNLLLNLTLQSRTIDFEVFNSDGRYINFYNFFQSIQDGCLYRLQTPSSRYFSSINEFICFSFMLEFKQIDNSSNIPPIRSHIIIGPTEFEMRINDNANPGSTITFGPILGLNGRPQTVLFNTLDDLSLPQLKMLYTLVTTGEFNFEEADLELLNINGLIYKPYYYCEIVHTPSRAIFPAITREEY